MSKRWSPLAREVRNVGASVRARLLHRARTEKTDFQILLTRDALERLLYRRSVSDQRDRFVHSLRPPPGWTRTGIGLRMYI